MEAANDEVVPCPHSCPAGAFYMRLVGRAVDVYQYLEPLYNDYRKVRLRQPDGSFALSHIDEVSKGMSKDVTEHD